MKKTCIPTEVPTTDETPTTCSGEYTSWECSITDTPIVYLNTLSGESLKNLIIKLIQKVSDLEAQITG